MRYDYDMLGNRIHQASMEAGERWMLNDVAGKPHPRWDSRGHQFRTAYDALRRPVETLSARRRRIRSVSSGARCMAKAVRILRPATCAARSFSSSIRPESSPPKRTTSKATCFEPAPAGAGVQDDAGLVGAAVPLEPEVYTSRTRYDALNRPTAPIAPDGSVYRPTFNEANLLEKST